MKVTRSPALNYLFFLLPNTKIISSFPVFCDNTHGRGTEIRSSFCFSKCLLINISAAYLSISRYRLLLHRIVFKVI